MKELTKSMPGVYILMNKTRDKYEVVLPPGDERYFTSKKEAQRQYGPSLTWTDLAPIEFEEYKFPVSYAITLGGYFSKKTTPKITKDVMELERPIEFKLGLMQVYSDLAD